ncbi:hypothetical protein BRADI_5g09115v3 [Brachypodium distachyon]|uniref:Uncharacterized protein n=1 Tax=Brachypodium distachyon TaxID=15368 RepID=A0A0Q3E7Z7_BRADI|nr:hypothetical protein BRADI_5g09115v3 [Brachypodium distachyon]
MTDSWSNVVFIHTCRDSLDLGRVRGKAASIIVDLVWRTPELKEHMTNARGPMKPQNILPIGFGFCRRRHVKRGPIPGSVLVRHYLHKRRMLPSSTSSHCEGLNFESLIKAKKWMVDLVEIQVWKLVSGIKGFHFDLSVKMVLLLVQPHRLILVHSEVQLDILAYHQTPIVTH